MKCFECQADAVGVCSRCARGLCPAHATFSVERMSCKGRCEAELKAFYEKTDQMIATGPSAEDLARATASLSGTRTRIAFMYLALGIILLAYGVYEWSYGGGFLFLAFGAVAFLFGLTSFLSARRGVTAAQGRGSHS